MNKTQIIAPLVALAIAGIVFAFIHGRNQHRYFVLSQTDQIGRDLISTTNSSRLVRIGPDLQQKLADFLASPARVKSVLWGDDSSVGDGKATSRVILGNAKQEQLTIRLRQEPGSDKFHVLGYGWHRAGDLVTQTEIALRMAGHVICIRGTCRNGFVGAAHVCGCFEREIAGPSQDEVVPVFCKGQCGLSLGNDFTCA
jgi:hypothetical protein